jgi:hypothetical protein
VSYRLESKNSPYAIHHIMRGETNWFIDDENAIHEDL